MSYDDNKNKEEYFSNTDEIYDLIKIILKEVYSKEISELGMDLLINGISTIGEILSRLKINFETLKNNLIILMQNNLVTYREIIKKNINCIGYELILENVFNIILFPRILSFVNNKYGEYGSMIYNEFISLGILNLSQIIEQIVVKKKIANKNIEDIKTQILITFKRLYEDGLIKYAERHSVIENNEDKENIQKKENKIANKRSNKKKTKKEKEKDDEINLKNSLKKFENELNKINNSNSKMNLNGINEIDINVFYEQVNKPDLFFFLNYKQIYAEFKSEIIINFINNNISLHAGLLASILLKNRKVISFEQGITSPMSYEEIINTYHSLNIKQLDDINKNNSEIFVKLGSDSIYLNIKKICEFIKTTILEKMILLKYSQEHLRVYRLLSLCGSLDAKNIMDQCLIIPKTVNYILNQLYQDGFLQTDNVSFKNTNMLFYSVNNHHSIEKILCIDYKIIKNLKIYFKHQSNTVEQKLNNDYLSKEIAKINYIYDQIAENIIIMKYF